MSDQINKNNLFEIPKTTAEAMQDSLKQLSQLEDVQDKLISLGIMDNKSAEQIKNLKSLTESIFNNFKVSEQ